MPCFVDYVDRLARPAPQPAEAGFSSAIWQALWFLALGVRVFRRQGRRSFERRPGFSAPGVWWSPVGEGGLQDRRPQSGDHDGRWAPAPDLPTGGGHPPVSKPCTFGFGGAVPLVWLEAPGWAGLPGAFYRPCFSSSMTRPSTCSTDASTHGPLLWCFHKVSPYRGDDGRRFTVYRTPPGRGRALRRARHLGASGRHGGVSSSFWATRVELMTVFGANVILFVFNVAGSNLRHSHVWISYGTRHRARF